MNVSLVSITESYLNNSEGQLTPEELIVYTARVSNPSNQMSMETSDRLLAYLVRNRGLVLGEEYTVTEYSIGRGMQGEPQPAIRVAGFSYDHDVACFEKVGEDE